MLQVQGKSSVLLNHVMHKAVQTSSSVNLLKAGFEAICVVGTLSP